MNAMPYSGSPGIAERATGFVKQRPYSVVLMVVGTLLLLSMFSGYKPAADPDAPKDITPGKSNADGWLDIWNSDKRLSEKGCEDLHHLNGFDALSEKEYQEMTLGIMAGVGLKPDILLGSDNHVLELGSG